MKPSHFQTPRTFDEATFYAGGAAIEKPLPKIVAIHDVVLYVLTVVAVGVVIYFA